MKRFFLLIMMSLCLSCSAQKTDPQPVITVPLTVISISGEEITFRGSLSHLFTAQENVNAFRIPENLKLEEGRIYTVSYQFFDCHDCFKKKIIILGYSVNQRQAQQDAAELHKVAKHLKPRE